MASGGIINIFLKKTHVYKILLVGTPRTRTLDNVPICPCPAQITWTLSDDNLIHGHMTDADIGQCPNMSTSTIYGVDIENVQHWIKVLAI